MAEKRKHIQHVKSKVDGKLPDAGVLLEGEIAVNLHAGNEMLAIENDEGKVVEFVPKHVVEDTFRVVSESLNDLNVRKADVGKYLTLEEAETKFATKSEIEKVTIDVDSALNQTSENPVQNKVIYDALDGKVSKETGKGLTSNDYTTAEKTKLSGISEGANKTESSDTNGNVKIDGYETTVYSLPTASSSVLGGVKIGGNLSIDDGVLSVVTENGLVGKSEKPVTSGDVHSVTVTNEQVTSEALNDLNLRVKILEDQTIATGSSAGTIAVGGSDVAVNGFSTVKAETDFLTGANTATSIASVAVSKRLVVATISAAGSFSLASTPAAGREIHVIVKNSGSSDVAVTLPNTGNYVSLSGDSLTVAAGKYAEINVISDGTNMYIKAAAQS